jgi:peptidoglycan hydrolase-like protein with peptidoglycan-binding domain
MRLASFRSARNLTVADSSALHALLAVDPSDVLARQVGRGVKEQRTAMSKQHRRPKTKRHLAAVAAVSALVVCAVVAGTLALVGESSFLRGSPDAGAAAATLPASSTHPPVVNTVVPPVGRPTPVSSAPLVPRPLHLVSSTPSSAATAVDGGAPIVLTFDAPVATGSALPTIMPATAGVWTHPTPTSLQFQPTTAFGVDATVSVTVPASITSTNGGTLATGTSFSYQVADGSLLGLQQLLAQLKYLPVTFTPATASEATADPGEAAFNPPAGAFAMRFPATPTALADLWVPGQLTPMTKGAIMAFENVHQLKVDGVAGTQVWSELVADATANKVDPQPYTWAWTTMTRPEMVQIWSNGSFVFSSLANTGIPAAPTPHGSWPVFLRYRSQTMRGTNPNGTKYDDPGVPYISYFNGGDAIHGFLRGSYGSQQSLGCVELPYASAAQVWALIDYGTVVTVT